MKKCSKCGEKKSLSEFSPHQRMKLGRQSSCKACGAKARKAYYERHQDRLKLEQSEYRRSNPLKVRGSLLKTLYGISNEDYDRLIAAQNYCCAICESPEPGAPGKFFHVDHDHATGIVRGLLCRPCNQGIGYFADDPQRLIRAARYLWKAEP